MRNLRIALNILMIAVSVLFVFYAQIQTDLAKESKNHADELAQEAVELMDYAQSQAAEAVQIRAEMEKTLKECQESK